MMKSESVLIPRELIDSLLKARADKRAVIAAKAPNAVVECIKESCAEHALADFIAARFNEE